MLTAENVECEPTASPIWQSEGIEIQKMSTKLCIENQQKGKEGTNEVRFSDAVWWHNCAVDSAVSAVG